MDFGIPEELAERRRGNEQIENEKENPRELEIRNNEDQGNIRQRLRDRNQINQPDQYEIPLTYFARIIPDSFDEALLSEKSKEWKKAMNEEMDALRENNTWELQELPAGRKAIGCKWVFSTKSYVNGELVRYKARLVAKGFSQREGVDCFETFSPVVRYESMRVILFICASEDLEIARFDVKTTFLNDELKEEIFME